MTLAHDLQINPPELPRPLKPALSNAIVLFYVTILAFSIYIGTTVLKGVRVTAESEILAKQFLLDESKLSAIEKEADSIAQLRAKAGDLSDWLSITPPAQALVILITQQLEPNVTFSRLAIEMEQAQPNAKITVELTTSKQESATRQIAKIQSALDLAGFRTATIDTDSPSPEGWKFSAIVALPRNGDFSLLKREKLN
jgi:hypothetical protein